MATPKKSGLGRGLESLFSGVEINTEDLKKGEAFDKGDGIVYIDVNDMKPNVNQPRKSFNDEKIEELAKSIEIHGIIQPIMVRDSRNGYEIVAGERRWRAARKAGLKKVPCLIRELDEQQNMLVAIVENMQREDLNPIEEALALEEMIKTHGLTQEEVSKSVGKSRPYITNALRLLKLPEKVRSYVVEGALSSGHARAIAGMKEESLQIQAADKAVSEGWSVREMERFTGEDAVKTGKRAKPRPREKKREIKDIENQLKDILGTKVTIDYGIKKGKIEIEYYSRDELERLYELLLSLK
ncbi:ParB/RepB/Spo0J family partition protein [Anaerovorax sp. IOR16]|uniref:ParB/RepB/Spo0J family partition protein n=1 Tax=Anaerovorax sp. IOR16 TaxID=2773458 RepID=UPI0019D1B36B|nr:ParB/RepB/Spo0J family partition protein [Anaerovorax sp. IOR16]